MEDVHPTPENNFSGLGFEYAENRMFLFLNLKLICGAAWINLNQDKCLPTRRNQYQKGDNESSCKIV